MTKAFISQKTCMCMYVRLSVMRCKNTKNRCSLLEVLSLTLDPCESETCLCFQQGPPPLLLSLTSRGGREGCKGSRGFSQRRSVFSGRETSSVPLLLHPSRLLTFTPDPVTPSSGFQQQQREEIREIDRLEGITVALFISGCAHS